MDLSNISEKTAKQLSSFIETTIFFFGNPVLRYELIEVSNDSVIITTPASGAFKRSKKFNPLLFYYAVTCIALGSAIQAAIPNLTEPTPIEKTVAIAIVLFLWIISALTVTLPARLLSKQFQFKVCFSVVIQAFSTLYVMCSLLAFFCWVIFSQVGVPFGFAENSMSLWYYPFHILLALIYIPWAVLMVTRTTSIRGFFLTFCIWVLILSFEGVSLLIWSLFHFAAYG